jgi:predicted nucleic acid-binding protein
MSDTVRYWQEQAAGANEWRSQLDAALCEEQEQRSQLEVRLFASLTVVLLLPSHDKMQAQRQIMQRDYEARIERMENEMKALVNRLAEVQKQYDAQCTAFFDESIVCAAESLRICHSSCFG